MILYFDCFSGISGDMTLGAFIDLGVPAQWLEDKLKKIPLQGFDLIVKDVFRNGIRAKSVSVRVDDSATFRNWTQIGSLITDSPLSAGVIEKSYEIFEKIADAESKIHGCSKKDVHFHEVGGVDSIVDIVGTALCVEYLSVEKIFSSRIPLGTGFVSCCHGILPVPVPATTRILKNIPVYGTQIPHELVTPTGASIIATLAESFGPIPDMIVEKSGYGAGEREFKSIPNLLRIIAGKRMPQPALSDVKGSGIETIVVLETDIDNTNPEIFGYLMDRLFEKGALDVCWVPVFMKKNRPGTRVQVLCRKNVKNILTDCILTETGSLGVRYYEVERKVLERSETTIETEYGKIKVKRVIKPGGEFRLVPEFEVCKTIALKRRKPLRVVYESIIESIQREMLDNGTS